MPVTIQYGPGTVRPLPGDGRVGAEFDGDMGVMGCIAKVLEGDRSCPRRVVAVVLTFGLVVATAHTARAATGDLLRSITAATDTEGCGVNVGIAFDGRHLLVSCVDDHGNGHTLIDYINPATGSLAKALRVPGHNGFAAMAYDAGRKKIWACEAPSGNTGFGPDVYLIDPTTGSSVKQFTLADSCWDGLAYDASDDTLYFSGDQSPNVYHYTASGKLIHEYTGVDKLLGGRGNSGIAVGGPNLYLSNADGNQIYTVPKNFSSSTLLATETSHLEDMECDSVTFAPKDAMWVIDAFDRTLNAYQIPAGSCGVGGAVLPVAGKSVSVGPTSGRVLVKQPGQSGFTPLRPGEPVPVGSRVDATHGKLRLVVATDKLGHTATAQVYGGVFRVGQRRVHRTEMTLLRLAGPKPTGCTARGATVARPPRHRAMWVRDPGHFITYGIYASATGRRASGTKWLTEDTCHGTLIRVARGAVLVHDFPHHRSVLLRSGHEFLAHPGKGG